MKKVLLFVAALAVCIACGGRKANRSTEAEAGSGAAVDSVKIYEPDPPPAIMTDGEAQARWLGEHWWDKFDFTDTLSVPRWGDYAEQAFVNFEQHLLVRVPEEMSSDALAALFRKAAVNKDVFQRFAEIAEKYLFDPNSPFRHEGLYIATLNAVLANPDLDEWERIRPMEQLRMAHKNRPGDRAADFRYTLANGATGTLHSLRATYTLLFFNNQGCPACRETTAQILASPYLSNLIENGTLVVMAVYSDEDTAAWRDYAPNIPGEWINAYDAAQKIKGEELYDLKAIPTLYLLDSDKRVMLKDEMSIPGIEQTIYSNENN